jgi:hypothetical protein
MNHDQIQQLKFEEYKLFVEDTARFTERRQTITNIYVAVNSILLTGIGLLLDGGLQNWVTPLTVLLLLFAGIFVCAFWSQLIRKYKELVKFRIQMLREIEERQDMGWSHQMYHREDELYPRDENDEPIKGVGLNFADFEQRLPFVFAGVYAVIAFFLVFGWAYGMV